jgi:aspartate aminotransferase/aminotransferase
MYKHLLTMAGGKSVIVDSYPDFRFHADRIEKAITPKTKLLILSDEIYEPFLYDIDRKSNNQLYSPAALYENVVILRGFSKSHAMTGWRLGYAAGPDEVIANMTKLQQYTFVCAPSPLQYAALKALDVPMDKPVADYRKKRDIVFNELSKKFEVVRPEGAFYIFPKAPSGMTATDFVTKAIDQNVLIIPGNVFSERDTHFRISYATTDEKLKQGCEILNSLAK